MQRLFGVFAAETGLVWLLHRAAPMFPVDLANPGTWLRFTPPDEIVMAALRYAALGLGYWLLLSTIVYTTGLIATLPGLVRSVEWATLPMVRSAARRAVALSLATTTMAPASAFVMPALLVPAVTVHHRAVVEDSSLEERDTDNIVVGISDRDTYIPPGATLSSRAPKALPSVATPRLSGSTNAGPPDQLTSRTNTTGSTDNIRGGAVHTVEPGDNLWTIAAHHLQTDDPANPMTEARIAPYWARVVELNRPSLRSQNPDWIYPGEEIQLPPIDE